MSWLDFVAVALAAGTPINAWLYQFSILASLRERVVVWGESHGDSTDFRSKLAQLLTCRFCMSHWTPALLILLFYLPSLFLREPYCTVVKLPIYSLAATRLTLGWGYFFQKLRIGLSDASFDNAE